MTEGWKNALIFLGGAAVGVLGAAAIARNKDALRPMAANLLSRGLDVKDAVVSKVETLKENVEDIVAEARQVADKRREGAASSEADA